MKYLIAVLALLAGMPSAHADEVAAHMRCDNLNSYKGLSLIAALEAFGTPSRITIQDNRSVIAVFTGHPDGYGPECLVRIAIFAEGADATVTQACSTYTKCDR